MHDYYGLNTLSGYQRFPTVAERAAELIRRRHRAAARLSRATAHPPAECYSALVILGDDTELAGDAIRHAQRRNIAFTMAARQVMDEWNRRCRIVLEAAA